MRAFAGLSHAGRVFLAESLYARYRGKSAKFDALEVLDEAERPLSDVLFERLADLEGVELRESLRSPSGTIGFVLANSDGTPEEAFLLGTEFAHVHVTQEHGLHLIVPESARTVAMERGWIEAHPVAGQPTVSPLTVLADAPRDEAEVNAIARLVRLADHHARGG